MGYYVPDGNNKSVNNDLFKTTDGGVTWNRVYDSNPDLDISESNMRFIASNNPRWASLPNSDSDGDGIDVHSA